MSPFARRRPGFTLVEVTLVIALGTIILAAAMAAFSKWRDQARVNAGKLHLASIQQSAAMVKYRTGKPLNLGYAGTATSKTSVAGNTQIDVNPAPDNSDRPPGSPKDELREVPVDSVVCLGTVGYRVTGVLGNRITVIGTVSETLPAVLKSGLRGNVDDQCSKLVSIPDPSPSPIPGMGLSDPWIGYTNVRPSPAADLPPYVKDKGFEYQDPQPPSVVWGGLAYMGNNEVQFVLPYPTSTPKPPARLGYFPGDPPKDWGGAR